jgi:hypothetical protein
MQWTAPLERDATNSEPERRSRWAADPRRPSSDLKSIEAAQAVVVLLSLHAPQAHTGEQLELRRSCSNPVLTSGGAVPIVLQKAHLKRRLAPRGLGPPGSGATALVCRVIKTLVGTIAEDANKISH